MYQYPGLPEDYADPKDPAGRGLPSHLQCELTGQHEGPVLAVRYNKSGSYCLSCGKASAGTRGSHTRI